jgi:hypothetical protein
MGLASCCFQQAAAAGIAVKPQSVTRHLGQQENFLMRQSTGRASWLQQNAYIIAASAAATVQGF